ncbi:hypothetical protein WS67_18230 [Burkholderia singularis]|uniref:Uncharacterized protein n=1 Tax=Burkholderia singularis TaxID=1503053 RepID=A0A118DMV9_9BURK|nr:hypothetical protein WS67_18230 [Burkholderia singularis]
MFHIGYPALLMIIEYLLVTNIKNIPIFYVYFSTKSFAINLHFNVNAIDMREKYPDSINVRID